jgi:hypothetical protein
MWTRLSFCICALCRVGLFCLATCCIASYRMISLSQDEVQRYSTVHHELLNAECAGELTRLKRQLVEQTHHTDAERAALKYEIDKLRTQLNKLNGEQEARARDAAMGSASVSPPLERQYDELRAQYDALKQRAHDEVMELRSKLSWYVENQQLIQNFEKKEKIFEFKLDFIQKQALIWASFVPKEFRARAQAALQAHYAQVQQAQRLALQGDAAQDAATADGLIPIAEIPKPDVQLPDALFKPNNAEDKKRIKLLEKEIHALKRVRFMPSIAFLHLFLY